MIEYTRKDINKQIAIFELVTLLQQPCERAEEASHVQEEVRVEVDHANKLEEAGSVHQRWEHCKGVSSFLQQEDAGWRDPMPEKVNFCL